MKRFLLFILICITLPSFALTLPSQRPVSQKIIDKLAKPFIQENNIPGMTIAIYFHSNPYFFNYGVANKSNQQSVTENTVFDLGSITKTFTATLLAMQVARGNIQLSYPVGPFLPLQLKDRSLPIFNITFQELATHTSGLPKYPPNYSSGGTYNEQQFIRYLETWRTNFPAGSQYRYSNVGYGVLGMAIQGITGQTFWYSLATELLRPLSMYHTTLDVPYYSQKYYAKGYNEYGNPAPRWKMTAWRAPSGALRTTAADMMNYLIANLGQGNYQANIKDAMQNAQHDEFTINNNTWQGLGWIIMSLGHGSQVIVSQGNTPGFSSFVALVPTQGLGIAIFANRTHAPLAEFAETLIKQLT